MRTPTAVRNTQAGHGRSLPRSLRGAATTLCLAASPTFAVMAWLGAGDPMGLCGVASALPRMNGMASMYLLMSVFHLPPWLELVRVLAQPVVRPATERKGD